MASIIGINPVVNTRVSDNPQYKAAFGRALAWGLQEAWMLRILEQYQGFVPDISTSTYRKKDAETTALQTRDKNGSYTKQRIGQGTAPLTHEQRMHGGMIARDIADERDDAIRGKSQSVNFDVTFETALEEELKSTFTAYDRLLMLGDGVALPGGATPIMGLSYILDGSTPTGLDVSCVIDAASNTTSDAGVLAFLKKVMGYKTQVPGAQEIWVSPELFAQLNVYNMSRPVFMPNAQVTPLLPEPVLQLDNQTKIRQLEWLTAEDATGAGTPGGLYRSAYIARVAPGFLEFPTNSGFDYTDSRWEEASMDSIIKWEISGGWRIRTNKSIRRLINIKVA